MWWLLFIPLFTQAQEEAELNQLRELEKKIKTTVDTSYSSDEFKKPSSLRYSHPYKKVTLKQILQSGTEHGHVKAGTTLLRIKDNHPVELSESFYGKFYKLQDDMGYRYIENNNGDCEYKMKTEHFDSIELELALYEPPTKYTPAPKNKLQKEFDRSLNWRPEASFMAGIVQGNYMVDLFNDQKAQTGLTTNYGFQIDANWKMPIKPGLAFQYEKSNYNLKGGGKIEYSSFSFGPQFKTKDFDFLGYEMRFKTQLRAGPFAKANARTQNGNIAFNFNSTDLLLNIEHPTKNSWGQFAFGLFYGAQWLSMKNQPEIISVKASNEINKSFGFTLAQVFE
jgi:hypothetical protein